MPATCYLDRLRHGLPPEDDIADEVAIHAPPIPVPVPTPDPEPTPVQIETLAPFFPSPDRPFWWFSSTAITSPRIPAGMPVRADPGARLPLEADWWCHEGDSEWVRVDHTDRPKPAPKKTSKKTRERW